MAVMAAVLLANAAVVLWRGDHFLLGSYEKRNNDDVKYIYAAQMLVERHTLVYNSGGAPTDFIMPAIPLMLSGFMAFLDRDGAVTAFRLLQCLMQTASVYLVFVAARALLGTRTALLAALLSACYVPDLFASGAILTESTFKLLFLLLVCGTLYALKSGTGAAWALVGILLGLACYVKPQSCLYPLCLFLIWLAHKYGWRQFVKCTAIVGVSSLLLLTPWWVRNYADFRAFIPFTNSSGNPMLLGALIKRQAPPQGFFEQYPEYAGNRLFAGSNSWEKKAAKRLIAYGFTHDPLRYAYWFTVGKTIGLFEGPFYSKPVPGLPRPAVVTLHVMYVIAGFAGIAASLAQRRFKQLMPLLLPFLYFWFIHLPFVTFGRYGYPLMWILTIFAASALGSLADWIRRRRSARQAEPANL